MTQFTDSEVRTRAEKVVQHYLHLLPERERYRTYRDVGVLDVPYILADGPDRLLIRIEAAVLPAHPAPVELNLRDSLISRANRMGRVVRLAKVQFDENDNLIGDIELERLG